MKLVTAIVRPFKFEEIRTALLEIGVQGMTITEVKGYGRQKGHTEVYRGAEYIIEFVAKTKIELAVKDDMLEYVLETIVNNAHTGNIGDGKIFVTSLEETIRIRTNEIGISAL